jgi:hypothetical protein
MNQAEILELIGNNSTEAHIMAGIALLTGLPASRLRSLTYEGFLSLTAEYPKLNKIQKNVTAFYNSIGRRNSKYLFCGPTGEPCSTSGMEGKIRALVGPLSEARPRRRAPKPPGRFRYRDFERLYRDMTRPHREVVNEIIAGLDLREKAIMALSLEGMNAEKIALELHYCMDSISTWRSEACYRILRAYDEKIHTVS